MLRTSSEVTRTEAPTDRAINSEVTRKIRVPRESLSPRSARGPASARSALAVGVTVGVGVAGLVQMSGELRPQHDEARGHRRSVLGEGQAQLERPGVGLLLPHGQLAPAFRQP